MVSRQHVECLGSPAEGKVHLAGRMATREGTTYTLGLDRARGAEGGQGRLRTEGREEGVPGRRNCEKRVCREEGDRKATARITCHFEEPGFSPRVHGKA